MQGLPDVAQVGQQALTAFESKGPLPHAEFHRDFEQRRDAAPVEYIGPLAQQRADLVGEPVGAVSEIGGSAAEERGECRRMHPV